MLRYRTENGRIIGENLEYFSNRMIYVGNSDFYILAGDRPLVRLGYHRYLMGTLRMTACGKPLEDSNYVKMSYAAGRTEWLLKDKAFGEITLTVTSAGDELGMAIRVISLVPVSFRYGGIQYKLPDPNQQSNPDHKWNLNVTVADASLLTVLFDDDWLKDNCISEKEMFIENASVSEKLQHDCRMFLRSDDVARADGCEIVGSFKEYLTIGMGKAYPDLAKTFIAGMKRSERLFNELNIETPNEYINAAARAAVAEIDGAWHPPKTMHGNASWNMPYVGWLMHVHHVLGHHERSKETLRAYADAQVKEDKKCKAERMSRGSMPGKNSRFYGKGYINEDQGIYNMQTQFFHQMISAWRYSGDPELAGILRDALRLHLEREDECFDPEGTGLYESTLNTWPTDSVCTSGGGAVEETCYVYAAVKAMCELTEGGEREYYLNKVEKIRKAFFDKLWIKSKGYPGAFIEWGGKKRLHEDAWIYSAFLPVECGLLDEFQTAQALYYPRWALKQDLNGLYWISNWIPGIWSTRECSWGENVQLAIADCMSGNSEDALRVLDGVAKRCLSSVVPCDLSYPVLEGSTQLVRAIVEGLFGYHPDYPNNSVEFAPQLPFIWEKASLSTSDFRMDYRRNALHVTLTRPARMKLRIKLYAEKLLSVTGAQNWSIVPSIGGRIVEVLTDITNEAEITLNVCNERDFESHVERKNLPEESEIFDPQDVASATYGNHMVFQKMPQGWWRQIRIDLGKNPERVGLVKKQRQKPVSGTVFEPFDISTYMNADVTTIFKQMYLTPRPLAGGSAQVGYDGFSLWTFDLWGILPPEIRLERMGIVESPNGIPIAINKSKYNVVFTTLWDNYPDAVVFRVKQKARSIHIAVCGSTNPMHCNIENARITFHYIDDVEEKLPLVALQNYIQLCAYPPRAATEGFECRRDVFNPYDECLLEDFTPEVIPLGENLRALLISWPLRDVCLESIKLETISPEIVCGIIGITLGK